MEKSITKDSLIEIRPKEIEQKLEEFFHQRHGEKAIRAALFNLVIYTKNPDRKGYLEEIVGNLVLKFPCRVIWISENESSNQPLKTFIKTEFPSKDDHPIFCDQIFFEIHKDHRHMIPFLLLPHLLADLSTHIFYDENPCNEDAIFATLEKIASRIIFDSENTDDLACFAATFENLVKKDTTAYGDLNWARLSPWRDLFVSSFDHPDAIDKLRKVDSVVISYNNLQSRHFSHNKIQSMYFQAWLASSFKWDFQSIFTNNGESAFIYTQDDHTTHVNLSPITLDHIPPGRIIKIELFFDDKDHIIFERDHQNPSIVAKIQSSNRSCKIPSYHHFDTEVWGLSMASEIYEKITSPNLIHSLSYVKKYQTTKKEENHG